MRSRCLWRVGRDCQSCRPVGREQRRPGVSASNSRSPAVARRLPRRTTSRLERDATAVFTARIREFDARGRAVREVRAATSVRRVGVMRKRAVGLPRVAGGCEGTDCTLAHAGGAVCWSRPALLAITSAARGSSSVERRT